MHQYHSTLLSVTPMHHCHTGRDILDASAQPIPTSITFAGEPCACRISFELLLGTTGSIWPRGAMELRYHIHRQQRFCELRKSDVSRDS